jgi:hypothetical protein
MPGLIIITQRISTGDRESLTPSPIIATKRDRRCNASIILTFVAGEQRAITNGKRASLSISSSENPSLSSCHDYCVGYLLGDASHIGREYADLRGDGTCCATMISCQHVNCDSRALALPDCSR